MARERVLAIGTLALLVVAAAPLLGAWVLAVAAMLVLLAAVGGFLVPTRPRLAAALLVVGSLLGFIAINLYDINTPYFVALPACWIAAVAALVARPVGGEGRYRAATDDPGRR